MFIILRTNGKFDFSFINSCQSLPGSAACKIVIIACKNNGLIRIICLDMIENLDDIASILTCFNISSNESREIIKKYNVSYIFTKDYDLMISGIFFKWFDKNTSEYVIDHELTDLARQTMVFQLWDDDYVPYGLDLVYDDELSIGSYLTKMRLFKVII